MINSRVYRGMTGHCDFYAAMGLNTASLERQRPGVPDNVGTKVEKTIIINRSPEELYRFWRNVENLPRLQMVLRAHAAPITALAFAADSDTLATASAPSSGPPP